MEEVMYQIQKTIKIICRFPMRKFKGRGCGKRKANEEFNFSMSLKCKKEIKMFRNKQKPLKLPRKNIEGVCALSRKLSETTPGNAWTASHEPRYS